MATKDAIKATIPKVNRYIERLGVRFQPVHYYSEVPDRRWLAAHRTLWARQTSLVGIEWDLDAQLTWLSSITAHHLREVPALSEWDSGVGFGPGYGPIEAQVLRCFIRHQQPRRIVEVGSGMSTAVAVQARDLNASEGLPAAEITCVEPYPSESLKKLPVTIVEDFAQAVPSEAFDQLDCGDLLFIDSTHAVHTGSDVVRIYLDIIPRLAPGVLIHVHDIYFPYLYSPNILTSIFDWQETTLLAALLTNNRRLKVLCCLSALCHERPDELTKVLPDCRPATFTDGLSSQDTTRHFPSSIWLQVE